MNKKNILKSTHGRGFFIQQQKIKFVKIKALENILAEKSFEAIKSNSQ